MTTPVARCRDHDLTADADGRCVLCRREARAGGPAPESGASSLPVLPIVLASSFGLVFVGGLVLSAFLLAGTDDAMAAADPAEPPSAQAATTNEPSGATGTRGQGQPGGQAHGGTAVNGDKADVRIEVYSASWCPACRAAKSWLDRNGYAYTDYDIDHDPGARGRLRTLNPRGSIPVIVVGGDRTFVGFDPPALEGAIAAARPR